MVSYQGILCRRGIGIGCLCAFRIGRAFRILRLCGLKGENVKHKKALISGLIVIAIVLTILIAGMGFVFWKINSYTAGNWLIESNAREYIATNYPDLDYEIVSRDIYETEAETDGRVIIVWELTIKCEGELHKMYIKSDQTSEREPLFFNVADYTQLYFDYEEK